MVSKCANPACHVPFRYLHEGRIFSLPKNARDPRGPVLERYWLCAACSENLTLVLQQGKVELRVLAATPPPKPAPARVAAVASRGAA